MVGPLTQTSPSSPGPTGAPVTGSTTRSSISGVGSPTVATRFSSGSPGRVQWVPPVASVSPYTTRASMPSPAFAVEDSPHDLRGHGGGSDGSRAERAQVIPAEVRMIEDGDEHGRHTREHGHPLRLNEPHRFSGVEDIHDYLGRAHQAVGRRSPHAAA